MKTPDMLDLPAELRYSAEHVWIRREGESCLVGISDYAQDQLGEVAFVDLPASGSHFGAGEEFGTVESMKAVSPLFMPVAGTVRETNAALEDTPTLVNVSCYDRGWMLRIEADRSTDPDTLLDAEAYRNRLA